MLRALVVLAAAGCLLRVSAQPAACESDQQCQSGFYCVQEVFLCRRCLDCEDLKRDPPIAPTACIKSVAECGSCFEGLVNDLGGDVSATCIAREAAGAGTDTGAGAVLPAWAWAAVSLGLLLFALVLVAVLYVLRHTNTFKILASTRTSVRSPGAVASATDAPPPYRAHYHHHRDRDIRCDTDVDHYDTDAGLERDHRGLLPDETDPSAPCEDGSPPSPLAVRKPSAPLPGPREAAASQATRYYSAPYYVRPPRYSDAGAASPAPPPAPPPLHDEDTMESTWTPSATAHDTDANAPAGELAELLAAARLERYHRQPPPPQQQHHHRPCVQDSDDDRGSGSAPAGAAPRPAPPPAPPVSYIINVVQNMQNRT